MKQEIKNRKGERVVVLVEDNETSKGLAIVMHGLGASKDIEPIVKMAEAFKEEEYGVVRFDATNAGGESDGKFENVTVTNYYEDLEDVIGWCKKQNWYKEPFVLCGHSLGGFCSVLYAEKFQERVQALALISCAVAGKHKLGDKKKSLEEWEKRGYKITSNGDRLNWGFMEDFMKYDILGEAGGIKVPVLLIVGEDDKSTPLELQESLHGKLNCEKELHAIKGVGHFLREEVHLEKLKTLLGDWIKSTLQKPSKGLLIN